MPRSSSRANEKTELSIRSLVLTLLCRVDGWMEHQIPEVENATNDPNIEYSDEFTERMNDSDDLELICRERMSSGETRRAEG